MKEKVIVIVGPTAVGKTELSLNLAKDLNGEIISGDSMQVYKELDIGTDKVTLKEREMVNHHLIDIIDMTEDFTVSDFQSKARNLIKEINGRGKIPIIVGGSGLYIQSVLYDYQFPAQARDEAITKDLENQIDTHGIEPLYNKLKEIDPEQAKKIHPNNHRRVVRALEIYKTTGLTMSEIQARQKVTSLYDVIFIGLEMEREILYERINYRVDTMIQNGLIAEVSKVLEKAGADSQSMSGIGYKEFIPYFNGDLSLNECIENLKRNSRRYAKRQYTWFKNKMDIPWYNFKGNNQDDIYDTIKLAITDNLQ